MDRYFDEFARMMARPTRRREAIRGSLGLAAALLAGTFGLARPAKAATTAACRSYCAQYPASDDERYNCMQSCLSCPSTSMLCGTNGSNLTCCSQYCVSGACQPCPQGQTLCSSTCTNTSTDTSNCGTCGFVCGTFANATTVCSNGSCGFTCKAGFGNCDGFSGNGCETNLLTDKNNCGTCGFVCNSFPNATSFCSNGSCAFTCNAGYGNCDGFSGNGCETNLSTDRNNCGSCGHACASNQVCSGGTCR